MKADDDLTADDFAQFLIEWMSLQQMSGRPHWAHEIQVPHEFEKQVKEMAFRPDIHSRVGWTVTVKGNMYTTPQDKWRGWMAFMNYPLVLVSGHDLHVVPRTTETNLLIQASMPSAA